ncbi:hypothetical protein RhiirA5_506914 [Rhizophagus irregularis]|uniref:Uncharacterized protein n=1 Tax=Rhizophagus irregularis TaxID=588596 RepID=A0A2N0NPS9_9GLOM|nr:hypothetical protein RhiirA5_506928 [Rhizophagus irregularis]PKB96573.1 hypothetical protein RhiirA5_506914 [Rhizophagus irregularis]
MVLHLVAQTLFCGMMVVIVKKIVMKDKSEEMIRPLQNPLILNYYVIAVMILSME